MQTIIQNYLKEARFGRKQSHQNLAIFPLLSGQATGLDYITLDEALAEELIAAGAYAEGDYERARREYNRLRFAAYAPPGLVQRATIALDTIPRVQAEPEAPQDETEDPE